MVEVRFNYDYFGTYHRFKFEDVQQAVSRWERDIAEHTKLSSIETMQDLEEALQKCVDGAFVDVRVEVDYA